MKKRWFDRLIGCEFYIGDHIVSRNFEGYYIFNGTFENSDHDDKRDPLQYEFVNDCNTLLLGYKEARMVMGAMIDKSV